MLCRRADHHRWHRLCAASGGIRSSERGLASMTTTQYGQKSIRELLAGHTVVGFITIGEDGKPNCRAMATQEAEPDMDLWFAARLDSEKVDELRKNPNVGLYYYNPERWSCVSIGGTVE